MITPADIREVQLAKSAISAGMKTMVSIARMDFEDIDAIYLAGDSAITYEPPVPLPSACCRRDFQKK